MQKRKAALTNATEIGCHISIGASCQGQATIPEIGNWFLCQLAGKAIYEELHPETKSGGDRRRPDRQVGALKDADRFAG